MSPISRRARHSATSGPNDVTTTTSAFDALGRTIATTEGVGTAAATTEIDLCDAAGDLLTETCCGTVSRP